MTTLPGPAARLQALREALESLGDALARPDAGPLPDAEAAIAAALVHSESLLTSTETLAPAERALLLAEARATGLALARCRRLGDSLTAFTTASLQAQALVGGYDRRGEARSAASARFGVRG